MDVSLQNTRHRRGILIEIVVHVADDSMGMVVGFVVVNNADSSVLVVNRDSRSSLEDMQWSKMIAMKKEFVKESFDRAELVQVRGKVES